jgi:hypothetical protein
MVAGEGQYKLSPQILNRPPAQNGAWHQTQSKLQRLALLENYRWERLKGGVGQVATRSSTFEGKGRQTERQTPDFRRGGTFRPYKQG